MNLSLHFDKGTIQLYGMVEKYLLHLDGIAWDERTNSYRTAAVNYRKLVTALRENNISFQDHARKFSEEEQGFSLDNIAYFRYPTWIKVQASMRRKPLFIQTLPAAVTR